MSQPPTGLSATRGQAPGARKQVYQLHIELLGITPPIWRQVVVPGQITLFGLSELLQVVMGWQNYHLHLFTIGETKYGMPDPEWELEITDERRTRLQRVAPPMGEHFRYEYDMGDGWQHQITVEAVMPEHDLMRVPWCTEGRRACPPEDCGGIGGYQELVEALWNRRHPEHRRVREWVGASYDPEVFSVQAVNSALSVLQAYVK